MLGPLRKRTAMKNDSVSIRPRRRGVPAGLPPVTKSLGWSEPAPLSCKSGLDHLALRVHLELARSTITVSFVFTSLPSTMIFRAYQRRVVDVVSVKSWRASLYSDVSLFLPLQSSAGLLARARPQRATGDLLGGRRSEVHCMGAHQPYTLQAARRLRRGAFRPLRGLSQPQSLRRVNPTFLSVRL